MQKAPSQESERLATPEGRFDTDEMEENFFKAATDKKAFEEFDDEDGEAVCSYITPEFPPGCPVVFTDTIKFSRDPETNQKIFNDNYIVLKEIGDGSFSKVKILRSRSDGKEYALKVYNKLSLESQKKIDFETGKWVNLLERAEREILAWTHLVGHTNIATLFEIVEQPGKQHLYLRSELGDLGHPATFDCKQRTFSWNPEVLQRLPAVGLASKAELQRNFFAQMVAGLEYMHSKGVAHRDVKLENLVVTKELRLLWIDFNSAKPFNEETRFTEYEGTLHYAAPECLWGLAEGYSPVKADVWALGVSLYALHFGCLPLDINPESPDFTLFCLLSTCAISICVFAISNLNPPAGRPDLQGNEYAYEMDMNIKIRDQAIDFRVELVDPDLEDLLKNMLNKSPDNRFDLQQVKAHKYLAAVQSLPFQSPKLQSDASPV